MHKTGQKRWRFHRDMPSNGHCCIPFCTNRQSKGLNLSFHIFLKDNLVKKKWIIAIKWDKGPEFHVSKLTVVCSNHFMDLDYVTGKRQGGTSGPSRSSKTLKRPRKNSGCAVCVFFLSCTQV